MRRTRLAAAALYIAMLGATFGIAACSKSDEATQAPPKSPEPAQGKPVAAPPEPLAVKPTDGEGFVASPPPKITGSFADGEAAYRARKYADATAIFEGYTERRPANAWGHYMLGTVCVEERRSHEVRAGVREGAEHRPASRQEPRQPEPRLHRSEAA